MIAALIAAFLHYTLPQHDIVRITGSYNRVTTVGSNKIFYANSDAGTADSTTTRDIRFIEAVRDNGNVIVYRNEDTGWIWPPYFKWDSSNVQAEASNLKSDKEAPIWVSITPLWLADVVDIDLSKRRQHICGGRARCQYNSLV